MDRGLSLYHHGLHLPDKNFQRTGTGVMLMEPTIFLGTRTNISHNIVDHAGLKDHPLHWLIDSTLCSTTLILPQLPLMPRLLLVVDGEELAKVVSHLPSMTIFISSVCQTPLVNNTLLTIHQTTIVPLSGIVKTAHHHHAQLDKLAKINAGLLNTRSTILTLPMTLLPKI